MEIEKQLMRVGLTEYESRVLISIAKNNEISAKEISINSGVPIQEFTILSIAY